MGKTGNAPTRSALKLRIHSLVRRFDEIGQIDVYACVLSLVRGTAQGIPYTATCALDTITTTLSYQAQLPGPRFASRFAHLQPAQNNIAEVQRLRCTKKQ